MKVSIPNGSVRSAGDGNGGAITTSSGTKPNIKVTTRVDNSGNVMGTHTTVTSGSASWSTRN